MKINQALFKPANMREGEFDHTPSSKTEYMRKYAAWLLSCIGANMELSESVSEIANVVRRRFPDTEVVRKKKGLYSIGDRQGNKIWIIENEAGEILLSVVYPVRAAEELIDITELGPEMASMFILSVLDSGEVYSIDFS